MRFARLLKWLRYSVLLAALLALLLLIRRFGIIRVPEGCPWLPPGSYILLDRQYRYGRSLQAGDLVIFRRQDAIQPTLGKIIAGSRRLPGEHTQTRRIPLPPGFYLVADTDVSGTLMSDRTIRARVLMIVMRPN